MFILLQTGGYLFYSLEGETFILLPDFPILNNFSSNSKDVPILASQQEDSCPPGGCVWTAGPKRCHWRLRCLGTSVPGVGLGAEIPVRARSRGTPRLNRPSPSPNLLPHHMRTRSIALGLSFPQSEMKKKALVGSRPVILWLKRVWESPGSLIQEQTAGCTPKLPDTLSLG